MSKFLVIEDFKTQHYTARKGNIIVDNGYNIAIFYYDDVKCQTACLEDEMRENIDVYSLCTNNILQQIF